MGDNSETIFNNQLFIRDCTCPKPECNELEIEVNDGVHKAVTRISPEDALHLNWFVGKWIKRKQPPPEPQGKE